MSAGISKAALKKIDEHAFTSGYAYLISFLVSSCLAEKTSPLMSAALSAATHTNQMDYTKIRRINPARHKGFLG